MTEILRDLSAPALVEAIEGNAADFFAYLGRSPRVELYDGPDMVRFVSGVPFPLCNDVLRARFAPDEADAKIGEALSHFQARQVPMLWWTGPSSCPDDLGERLIARGLVPGGSPPGMGADLLSLPDIPAPAGLTIEEVRDAATLEQFGQVLQAGFDIPDFAASFFEDVFTELGFGERLPLRNFVGLADGVPVTASSLYLGAGVAGIYNVATLAGARGKGFGAAITLEPLRQARAAGYRVGILQSSDMGYNVYRRLGFEEYCKFHIYAWLGGATEEGANHA